MSPTRHGDSNRQPRSFINAAIVITAGLFATSLAQPQILAGIPLENLLKNELHVDRAANAAFFFWASIAWYFKPLVGVITDSFPLFGSRRKSYLLISTSLAVACWIGLYFTPHEYHRLLWAATAINVCMVLASTVVGAYMVEIAQALSGSGRLASIRNVVEQSCLIVSGPGAGYLASVAFGWTAAVCGGVMFLLVPVTILFLHEKRFHSRGKSGMSNAGQEIKKIAAARYMWFAAGLMVLFYVAPGLGTALFYKQQNDLHLTTQAQGTLQLIGAVCGIAAAIAYSYLCRRWNLRVMLLAGLGMATLADLGYLFYSSWGNAQRIEGFNGFGFALAELAIMDLAIRATPRGSEGFAFSLMMSVRNFALFGTDWFGSALIERLHWSFNSVVFADAATTAAALPLVLLLPVILVRRRDDQPVQPDLAVAIEST